MENEVPDFFHERDALGLEKPKFDNEDIELPEYIEPVELNVTYASLGIRILAYLIDTVLLIFPLLFLEFLIWGENYTSIKYSIWKDLLRAVYWTAYFGYMESSDSQATFGKKICGLKVIDEKGNKLTFKKACLRYLAKVISILPLGFGIWSIAWDEKKQSWHDMLVGCYVIKK